MRMNEFGPRRARTLFVAHDAGVPAVIRTDAACLGLPPGVRTLGQPGLVPAAQHPGHPHRTHTAPVRREVPDGEESLKLKVHLY